MNPDGSGNRLREIADTARAVVDSMSDIVWSIDPRLDALGSVALRARQFAADVLESKGIQLNFQIPSELESLKLRPDQRRHLLLILKEALTNAASHAHCSSVSLCLDFVAHELRAEICDDGCGFKTGQPAKPAAGGHGGHGLENMRSRVQELGGHFNLDSSPGRGTRLALTIPIKRGA
jgi:signal transduction histidine kinase